MAQYHALTSFAGLAIRFVEAESRAEATNEFQNILERYSSERDNLLEMWHRLVRYIEKHKREKPEEPLSTDEVLLSLLSR